MIKENSDFIKKLAKDHGLPEFVIKQVVDSPFRFLRSVMEKREFEGVMFPYLGKFIVPPKTKEYMQKYLYERDLKGSPEPTEQEERGEGEEERVNM